MKSTETKNGIFVRIGAVALVVGILSQTAQAESAKKIFDSGFRNALKVLKYEKEKSSTKENYSGQYCIGLYRSTDVTLKPFDAMKMESMGINLGLSPAYFSYDVFGENKNIFCLDIQSSQNKAVQSLKKIREDYPKIDNFNPLIVELDKRFKYDRAIPFLGVLSSVRGEGVTVLIAELESKKRLISQKNKKIKELSERLSVAKEECENSSASPSDTPPEVRSMSNDKSVTQEAQEMPPLNTDGARAQVEERKKMRGVPPIGVSKTKSSDRVFVIEKK